MDPPPTDFVNSQGNQGSSQATPDQRQPHSSLQQQIYNNLLNRQNYATQQADQLQPEVEAEEPFYQRPHGERSDLPNQHFSSVQDPRRISSQQSPMIHSGQGDLLAMTQQKQARNFVPYQQMIVPPHSVAQSSSIQFYPEQSSEQASQIEQKQSREFQQQLQMLPAGPSSANNLPPISSLQQNLRFHQELIQEQHEKDLKKVESVETSEDLPRKWKDDKPESEGEDEGLMSPVSDNHQIQVMGSRQVLRYYNLHTKNQPSSRASSGVGHQIDLDRQASKFAKNAAKRDDDIILNQDEEEDSVPYFGGESPRQEEDMPDPEEAEEPSSQGMQPPPFGFESKKQRSNSFRVKNNFGDEGAINVHETSEPQFRKMTQSRKTRQIQNQGHNTDLYNLNAAFHHQDEEEDEQEFFDCHDGGHTDSRPEDFEPNAEEDNQAEVIQGSRHAMGTSKQGSGIVRKSNLQQRSSVGAKNQHKMFGQSSKKGSKSGLKLNLMGIIQNNTAGQTLGSTRKQKSQFSPSSQKGSAHLHKSKTGVTSTKKYIDAVGPNSTRTKLKPSDFGIGGAAALRTSRQPIAQRQTSNFEEKRLAVSPRLGTGEPLGVKGQTRARIHSHNQKFEVNQPRLVTSNGQSITLRNRKSSKSLSKSRRMVKGGLESKQKNINQIHDKEYLASKKKRNPKSPTSADRFSPEEEFHGGGGIKKKMKQLSPIHKNRQSIYDRPEDEDGRMDEESDDAEYNYIENQPADGLFLMKQGEEAEGQMSMNHPHQLKLSPSKRKVVINQNDGKGASSKRKSQQRWRHEQSDQLGQSQAISYQEEEDHNLMKNQNLNSVAGSKRVTGSYKIEPQIEESTKQPPVEAIPQEQIQRLTSRSVYQREGQSNYDIMRQATLEGDSRQRLQPNKSMSEMNPSQQVSGYLSKRTSSQQDSQILSPIFTSERKQQGVFKKLEAGATLDNFDDDYQIMIEEINNESELEYFPHVNSLHLSEERAAKLVQEVYYESNEGGFFGLFGGGGSSQTQRQPRGSRGTQGNEDVGFSSVQASEFDMMSSYTLNSFRNIEFHKQAYQQTKQAPELPRNSDPLDQNQQLDLLWNYLEDQDEKLIFSRSSQVKTKTKDSIEQPLPWSLYDPHKIQMEHPSQVPAVPYDFVPEVQRIGKYYLQRTKNRQASHYLMCHHKYMTMKNFRVMKAQRVALLDEVRHFNLRNSIIPAIQGHTQIMLGIHKKHLLSMKEAFDIFKNSCSKVQNWTQAMDFGPFKQERLEGSFPLIERCRSDQLSTAEFFILKKYQVDNDLESSVNTLYNPGQSMFHVDKMGNLLSNLKLAFYEQIEEPNFISKMFIESQENSAREDMVKTYQIVREIYDDICTPIRLKQLRGRAPQETKWYDTEYPKMIAQATASGRAYDEIQKETHNLSILKQSTVPWKETVPDFYSDHLVHVLGIDAFTMSEAEYRSALVGFPLMCKATGQYGRNTQTLLQPKIQLLKNKLRASRNEFEFDLISYIYLLQSINYNVNLFGRFNPLVVDEAAIAEKLRK